jgi:hypothetical protein
MFSHSISADTRWSMSPASPACGLQETAQSTTHEVGRNRESKASEGQESSMLR